MEWDGYWREELNTKLLLLGDAFIRERRSLESRRLFDHQR